MDIYLELVLKKTKNLLTLPIDRVLYKMIQDHKEYCLSEFNVIDEHIFFNYKTNKQFSYIWCNKRINVLNNSGVLGKVYDNIGTHSIRKGLAEYLYNKKGLRTTQYLLGHKSMLTTEIYLELDKERHLKDLKEVLEKYKFAICYENARDISGYITEKIFDSFFSGCIPVYWGASNIEDYVPSDCFIDRRKFTNTEEVYHFLTAMTENEFIGYQQRIVRFLQSAAAYSFSSDFFAETIVKTIVQDLGI